MAIRAFNRAGVKAMIHFVAREYAYEPSKIGAIKLHKILWNTEIQMLRRAIETTGETFIKRQFGPYSEHLDEIVGELVAEGRLNVSRPTEEYEKTLFVGKGNPDRTALSEEQWRVFIQVVTRIADDHTATSISERSHGFVWEASDMYEHMSPMAEALQWNRRLPDEICEEIIQEAVGLN